MRQILWFRRDLRISDSAILAKAKNKVLPIFIFDKNILDELPSDDKRVSFIYQSVLNLKEQLKSINLDLAIFYGKPKEIFSKLKNLGFDEVLCSCDFDKYAIARDKEIEDIIPMKKFSDSFLIKPWQVLKKDGNPYKVFTPFYKSLDFLYKSDALQTFKANENLELFEFDYTNKYELEDMGFKKQELPLFLQKNVNEIIKMFSQKFEKYEKERDFFYLEASSNLAVFLRFGIISPKELFNKIKALNKDNSEGFIRQLFWRDFYNYILFHFPQSQDENFNGINIPWNENEDDFIKWCEGKTGVPIVDAAMRHLNKTGMMHNRLRMVVSSFLTKNLLIDWRKGERYFALKLLDYEASSNIGSWQWAASTGADAVPYFRIFNPYLQSSKFDKNALFIKEVIPALKDVDAKLIHKENALSNNLLIDYINPIVSIEVSRNKAIETFKKAKNEKT